MLTAPTLHAARTWPDRPAVGGLTYAELEARVVAMAAALPVAAGDVVALWGPASEDWVVAFHAVTRVGAAVLPLSTRWTQPELEDVLTRSGAKLLLQAPDMPHVLDIPAGPLQPAATSPEMGEGAITRSANIPTTEKSPSSPPAGEVPARAEGAPVVPESQPEDQTLLLVPTSGTTGRPKLVRLPWSAAHASARAVNQVLQLSETDTWWCALPLFHVGGLGIIMRTALAGARLLLAPHFDRTAGATIGSFVPTMLAAALEEGPLDLRVAMLGGAAIPPTLIARCPQALPSYGLTEACSTLTLAPPDSNEATRASSGPPLPGVEIEILDPGPDGVGRIRVRGPMVMTGYLGHPDIEDWLETGDFGHLDEQGNLHVAARREDLIISGGENVYPAEVEAALMAHPQVAYAAVVARPDERWGQTPHAFVVLRGEVPDFKAWLVPRLARYKHPSGYTVLPALPLLANGKVDRQRLEQAKVEVQAGAGG